MGSPAIFNGAFTKLLTSQPIIRSDGGLIDYAGPKNYINNNHFEQNLNGWSLFNTTMTNYLPTGPITTGASSLTLSRTGTSPIRGSYSMQLSATTWTYGQGVISDPFTIDNADLGSILNISYAYKIVANGGGFIFSGDGSTQGLGFYIYDVTAGQWLQPIGLYGMSSDNQLTVNGMFQTSNTSGQQYRLAILAFQSQIGSGGITINFDDFSVSPQVSVIGAVKQALNLLVTSQLSLTQNAWNVIKFQSAVGDSASDYSSSTGLFTCPVSGDYTINSALLNNTSSGASSYMAVYHNGSSYRTSDGSPSNITASIGVTVPCIAGDTLQIQVYPTTASPVINIGSNSNESFCSITWQGNVQLSPPVGAPVVGMSINNNSPAVSFVSGTPVIINFGAATYDTQGEWNGSNTYTAKTSGKRHVSMSIAFNAATTQTSNSIYIYQNGSNVYQLWGPVYTSGGAYMYSFSHDLQVNAGDTIAIYTQAAYSSGAPSTPSGQGNLSISMIPSMAATYNPVVAMSYTSAAGQSIPNSTLTTIIYGTKDFDTFGSYNPSTGVLTFNISGTYQINAAARLSLSTTNEPSIQLIKNGTTFALDVQLVTTSANPTNLVSKAKSFIAGDTLQVGFYQSSGGPVSLSTDANETYFDVFKVG